MSNIILLKRLTSEYEEIKRNFRWTKHIQVIPNEKDPPDEYVVIYRVNSIGKKDGQLQEIKKHIVHIYLSHNFFDVGPTATFKSPHFHPNIYANSNKFCAFSSSFRAAESLSDYIMRLGEVIPYKSFNLDSPANKEAKEWAKNSKHLFPLDQIGRASCRERV